MPQPTVQPTGPAAVGGAALVGAAITWIILSAIENAGWPAPQVPVLAAVVIAVLALGTWWAARWTHRTVQVQGDPVEPSRAVGLLLAGKAALIGGAVLTGGYGALALRYLPSMDAALPRERVLAAGAVALLSVGLAVAGWALERACQVPPDDESGDAPGTSPGPAHGPG